MNDINMIVLNNDEYNKSLIVGTIEAGKVFSNQLKVLKLRYVIMLKMGVKSVGR